MADNRRLTDHLYSNRPPDPRKHIVTIQRSEQRGNSPIKVIRRSPVPPGSLARTPPPAHSRVSPAPQGHKRVSPVPPYAHNRESPIHLTGKPLSLAQAHLPQAHHPGAQRPVYLQTTQPDARTSPQFLLSKPPPLTLAPGYLKRSPSPTPMMGARDQFGIPQNLSRPSSRESPHAAMTRLSPSQAMLSGGGLVQVQANRISPVPSHMYPPARPGSREERPPSRESWQSSRPSSRDSNVSAGRPSSRESPRTDSSLRTVSPSREQLPSRQLHQLLTQTHPVQKTHPVQILTAHGIQVVQPGQPAGQVPMISNNRQEQLQISQKKQFAPDQRRYLSPTQVIRGLSPSQADQLRRESAPNILRRIPSPHQQHRRESAPNTALQPHPKIKIEEASPPSRKQLIGKAPIPNPFFSGLKLPVQVSQQQTQESLQISRSRPTPTSAEVTASQALAQLMEMKNQQISQPQLAAQNSKPVAPHSTESMPTMSLAEGAVAPLLQDVPASRKKNIKKEPEDLVTITNQFNMRVMTLANFPVSQTSNRSTYRSHTVAIHRAKAGSITNTAKSLDLMRQNLQKHIDKEIDAIIKKYLDQYFKYGIENIKSNNGESSVTDDHINGVCRQILEEAKKMYGSEIRSGTPDVPDNVSESGSTHGLPENKYIREKKRSLFKIRRRRNSSDSETSTHGPSKRKKGRPPVHGSGRATPSKTSKAHEPVKREGPKWDPDRLKTDTLFVMGARANKALGLGATRGRIYIKHPNIFKYSGDQDDKQWLQKHNHMPASGGKAYMLLVEDIQYLAETNEYKSNSGLLLHELVGFSVPDWILDKMKIQMQSARTDAHKAQKPKTKEIQELQQGTNNNAAEDDVDDRSSTCQDDDDEEVRLPFQTMAQRGGKSMPQGSPANTDNFDAMSTDNEDGPPISPFNNVGAFGSVSPAPDMSPAASDLDTLEDDNVLPFDMN